jgi:ribosomal protein S27AE
MATRERIRCPKCGTPMNRHAEKIDVSSESGEAVLTEFHACPGCGAALARPAPGATKGHDYANP